MSVARDRPECKNIIARFADDIRESRVTRKGGGARPRGSAIDIVLPSLPIRVEGTKVGS